MSGKILNFAEAVAHPHDLTYLSEYFLGRMDLNMRPSVVLVQDGAMLKGVMYTSERTVAGIPTGWCFGGDEMGRGLLLASPEQEDQFLDQACTFLFEQGVHALRLRRKRLADTDTTVPKIPRSGVQIASHIDHRAEGDWLDLAGDYEQFLARLGPHTRRNLRYYRRRAESDGVRFVPEIEAGEYEQAVSRLKEVADFPHPQERRRRDQQLLELIGAPVLVGLQAAGRYVSVLSAVRFGDSLHVMSQLNDKSLRRMSLSVVLRSYLIEQAIQQGIRSIHFINGATPMLGRFCRPAFIQMIALDLRGSLAHPLKVSGARFAHHRQRKAQWVSVRLRTMLGSYFHEN